MAYVPLNLSIVNWASPINIVGTDKVINLDEAVNQIITSDAQSLVNHINTEMAKITPYLSTELSKIYAEVDDRVVAAEAAKVAAQAAQAAAEAAQTAAETAKTAAEAAQAAAAASEAAALASKNAAAASATAASGSETNAAASAAAAAASESAAAASQAAAAASAAAAATSENNSQLREWEAEAWKLTAQSYAVEAEDVPVNLVTSDGDGTFTYTPQTGVYSALHHRTKGLAQDASTKLPKDGSEPMTGSFKVTTVDGGAGVLVGEVTDSIFNQVKLQNDSGVAYMIHYGSSNAEDGALAIKNQTTSGTKQGDIFFTSIAGEMLRIDGTTRKAFFNKGIDVPATAWHNVPLEPQQVPVGGSISAYVRLGMVQIDSSYSFGVMYGTYIGGGGAYDFTIQVSSGATAGVVSSWSVRIRNRGNTTPLTTADFRINAYTSGVAIRVELFTKKHSYNYGAIKYHHVFHRHSNGTFYTNPILKTDDANLNDAISVIIE